MPAISERETKRIQLEQSKTFSLLDSAAERFLQASVALGVISSPEDQTGFTQEELHTLLPIMHWYCGGRYDPEKADGYLQRTQPSKEQPEETTIDISITDLLENLTYRILVETTHEGNFIFRQLGKRKSLNEPLSYTRESPLIHALQEIANRRVADQSLASREE